MPKDFMLFWFSFVFIYFSLLHHCILHRHFSYVSRQQAIVQSIIVGIVLTAFAIFVAL